MSSFNPGVKTPAYANPPDEPSRSPENLAFLAQGLLTGFVRLQAGREHMPDAETFRRRTVKALDELDRDGRALGYSGDDIQHIQFALVAFLDSVVLNSSEPGRAEWERKSLAMQMFNIADAGEVFFEKLDGFKSQRDSQHLADILEVFTLCLLLGYEGRYSGSARSDLAVIIERVRRRIDGIRGRHDRISPAGALPDGAAPALPAKTSSLSRYRLAALAAMAATLLLFVIFKLDLVAESGRALRSLLPL